MKKKHHDQDRRVPAKAVLSLTITGPLPGLQAFVDATQESATPTRRLFAEACYVQKHVEDLPDNLVLVAAQSNLRFEWLVELSRLHPTLTIDANVAMLARDPQMAMAAEFENGQRVLGWLERELDQVTYGEIRSAFVLKLTAPIQQDANRLSLGAAGTPEQIDAFVRALLGPETGSPLEVLAGHVVSVERPAPGRAHLMFDVTSCPLTSDAIESFYRLVPVDLGRAQILSPNNRGQAAVFRDGKRTTPWLEGSEHDVKVLPPGTDSQKRENASSPTRGGGR